MMRRRQKIGNNKKLEQLYVHLLLIAYGSTVELTFLFHRRKIESSRSRSLNHPITTLLFVSSKYYDGSVALYINFVCNSAIPKFLFDPKKEFFLVLFHKSKYC